MASKQETFQSQNCYYFWGGECGLHHAGPRCFIALGQNAGECIAFETQGYPPGGPSFPNAMITKADLDAMREEAAKRGE